MLYLLVKKINGQTLIEAMLTLLIMGICVTGLVKFQNYLAFNNSLMQQKSTAMNLAVKQIETLCDFQVLNNTTGYTSYQSIASGSSTFTGVTATYTIRWTVTSYTNPTYKNIDVTVSWSDRYGASQSVQLVTRVAGIDPQNSAAII